MIILDGDATTYRVKAENAANVAATAADRSDMGGPMGALALLKHPDAMARR